MENSQGAIVFVEVKSRLANPFGSPLEQVTPTKISHLKRAIAIYIDERNWQVRTCRLDAVGLEYTQQEVEALSGDTDQLRIAKISHIEDITGW